MKFKDLNLIKFSNSSTLLGIFHTKDSFSIYDIKKDCILNIKGQTLIFISGSLNLRRKIVGESDEINFEEVTFNSVVELEKDEEISLIPVEDSRILSIAKIER